MMLKLNIRMTDGTDYHVECESWSFQGDFIYFHTTKKIPESPDQVKLAAKKDCVQAIEQA